MLTIKQPFSIKLSQKEKSLSKITVDQITSYQTVRFYLMQRTRLLKDIMALHNSARKIVMLEMHNILNTPAVKKMQAQNALMKLQLQKQRAIKELFSKHLQQNHWL